MSLYLGMGTVASPNHHLEASGPVFFESVENSASSTVVPLEVHSDYSTVVGSSYLSRQLRFRITTAGGTILSADQGIDQTGTFFYVSAPNSSTSSANHDSTSFTINANKNVGMGTSDAKSRLEIKDNDVMTVGNPSVTDDRQWAIKTNANTAGDFNLVCGTDSALTAVSITSLNKPHLTIRKEGYASFGLPPTPVTDRLYVGGSLNLEDTRFVSTAATASDNRKFEILPTAGSALDFNIGSTGVIDTMQIYANTLAVPGNHTMSQSSVSFVETPVLPWSLSLGNTNNLFQITGADHNFSIQGGGTTTQLAFDNFSTVNFNSDTLVNLNGNYTFSTNTNAASFFLDTSFTGWSLELGKSGERVGVTYGAGIFSVSPQQTCGINLGSTVSTKLDINLDTSGGLEIFNFNTKSHEIHKNSSGFFLTSSDWTSVYGLGDFHLARVGTVTTVTESGTMVLDTSRVSLTGNLAVEGKVGVRKTPTAVVDVLNDTGADSSLHVQRLVGAVTTDHLRLDATGNLSVGTGTASASLHVQNLTAGQEVARISSTTGTSLLYTDGGLLGVGAASPLAVTHVSSTGGEDSLLVEKSGTKQLYLTAAGNLGVGPVNLPGAALDIINANNTQSVVRALTTSGGSMIFTDGGLFGTGGVPDAHLTIQSSTGAANSVRIARNGYDNLVVDSVGRVGITKTPTARLDLLNYSTGEDSLCIYRRPGGVAGSVTDTHLKMDSLGNLGLGITPTAKLDVLNTISGQPVVMALTTGGTPLTFTDAGLLGVGTTNPFAAIHTSTVGSEDSLRVEKVGVTHMWLSNSGNLGVGTQSTPAAAVDVSNLTVGQPIARFTSSQGVQSAINDSQELGVGTASPLGTIHALRTNAPASLRVEVQGATTGAAGHAFLEAISSNLGESSVMFKDDTTTSHWSWANEWNSAKIHLRRDTANFTGIPWITADSAGGVGILEASPTSALSVTNPGGLGQSFDVDGNFVVDAGGNVSMNGTLNIVGDTYLVGDFSLAVGNRITSGGFPVVDVVAGTGADPCDRIRLSVPGSSVAESFASLNTDGTLGVGVDAALAKLHVLNTNQTRSFQIDDAVVVDSGGSVGVGTLSPTDPLHVALETDMSGVLACPTSIRLSTTNRNPTLHLVRGDENDLDSATIQRPQSDYGLDLGMDGVDSYLDFNSLAGKNKQFDFKSGGVVTTSLLADGTVGIGTRTPLGMLEIVDGTGAGRDALVVGNTFVDHTGKIGVGRHVAGESVQIAAGADGDGLRIDGTLGFIPRVTLESTSGLSAYVQNVDVAGDHRVNCVELVNDGGRFNFVSDSATGEPALTIIPSGFTGINTKTPRNRFHVADDSQTLLRMSATRTNAPWVWDFDLLADGTHDGTYTLNTQGDTSSAGVIFTDDGGTDGTTDYGALLFKAGETGSSQEARFVLCVGGESTNAMNISADRDDSAAAITSKRYVGMEVVTELVPTIDPLTGNISLLGEYGVTRTIFRNGRVGIGTDAPRYPLEVNSYGYLGATDVAYWVHEPTTQALDANNPGVTLNLPTSANFIGIHSEYSISTDMAVMALSDRRVKSDIRELDDEEALGVIRKLKPSRFRRHDIRQENPNKFYYGLIAQEVEEVLPHAVSTSQSKDDCIFDYRKYVGQERLGTAIFKFTLHDPWDITANERIKVVFELARGRAAPVNARVTLVEDSVITVELDSPLVENQIEGVYIPGRVVNDLKHVDYNLVHNVSLAAIQEVDRENAKLKKKVLDLEVAMGQILKRLAKLED